jgi:NADPH2:quinone reductase
MCGADLAVDYGTDEWTDQLAAAVPDGFDIIVNGVRAPQSSATVDRSPFGRLVRFGAAGGEPALYLPRS